MAKNRRSQDVDTKIVKMEFDNKSFESNVATTMSTLEKLKRLLSFKGIEKGFEKLDKSAGGFESSMSGMEQAISKVTDQMSTLELIGRTALINLTNKAVDAGLKIAKSLSVDQLTEGWKKYEDKTKSVQSIMSADPNLTINQVNAALDKLNRYTDETSYNFVDMTSNIGKFMSAGQGLDESVEAMQGIANWAAAAGQGADKAANAMYNISQAMGTGSMAAIDWKSIENANMGTKEAKELFIRKAVELGKLTQEQVDNGDVTYANFRDTLKDRWLTADVMKETFREYNKFYKEVETRADKFGMTITETISSIKKVNKKIQDGAVYEDLTDKEKEFYVSIDGQLDHLSMKALLAAQEAKSLSDALGSIKDAVSTSWMKTFEWIFGDYERAKVLWSDVAEIMYHVFAEGGELRNQVLMLWNTGWQPYNQEVVDSWSGGKRLMEGIYNFFKTFIDILDQVKKAFSDVFLFGEDEFQDWKIAHVLWEASNAFRDFTASLNLSEDALSGLYHVAKIFFKGVKIGVDFVVMLVKIFAEFVIFVRNVINDFLEWVNSLYKVEEAEKSLNKETEKTVTLFTYFGKVVEFVKSGFNLLREGLKQVGVRFKEFTDRVKELDEFKRFVEYWKTQGSKFKEVMKNTFGETYEAVAKFLENTRKNFKLPTMDSMVEKTGNAMKWLREHLESAKQAIIEFAERTDESFKKWGVYDAIKQYTSSIRAVWDGFIKWLKSPDKQGISFDFGQLDGKGFLEKARTLGKQFIHQFMDGLGNTSMKDILAIGGTGGFIWFLIGVKKKIDSITKEWNIGEIIKNAGQSLASLKGVLDAKKLDYMSVALLRFAQSIGILVVSIMVLAQLPEDKLATITTIIAILGVTLALILKNNKKPDEYVKFSDAFMEFANGVAKGLRTFAKLVGISAVVVAVASSLIGITAFILTLKGLNLEDYMPAIGLLGIISAGLLAFVGTLLIVGEKSSGKGAGIIIALTIAIVFLMKTVGKFPFKSLDLFVQIFQTIGNLLINVAGLILAAAVFEKFAKASATGTSSFAKTAIRFLLAVGTLAIGVGLIMHGFKEFTEYLPVFVRTITENGPAIAKAVETILSGILIAIVAQKSKMILTIATLILAVVAALDTIEPEVVEKVVKQIVKMVETVGKYAGLIVDALVKILVILMDELANAINRNTKPLLKSVSNLVNSIINLFSAGIKTLIPILDDTGAKLVAKVGVYSALIGVGIKAAGGVAKAGKNVLDVFGSIGKFNTLKLFKSNLTALFDGMKKFFSFSAKLTTGAASLVTPFKGLTTVLNTASIAGVTLSQVLGGILIVVPLIAAAIGAVVAITAIWNAKAKHQADIMYGLTSAQKDQLDQTQKLKESHDEWMASSDTANLSLAKESNIVKALCAEYDRYLDENGKVKEGYESRADLILGKVSQATGLEKSELLSLIETHKSLTAAAQESLAVRFGSKYLEKHQDQYFAAVGEAKQWEIQATVNEQSIKDTKEKLNKLNEWINTKDNNPLYNKNADSSEYSQAVFAAKKIEENLVALEAQKAIIQRNSADTLTEIARYEQLSEAIKNNDYAAINKFREDISSQFSMSMSDIQEKGSDTLSTMYKTAENVLKIMQSSSTASQDQIDIAMEDHKKSFENYITSMISGSDDARKAVIRYKQDIANILGENSDLYTAVENIESVLKPDLESTGRDVAQSYLQSVADNIKDGKTTVEDAAASIATYFNIPDELLDVPQVRKFVNDIAETLKDGKVDEAMQELGNKLRIDNEAAFSGFEVNSSASIIRGLLPDKSELDKFGIDLASLLKGAVSQTVSGIDWGIESNKIPMDQLIGVDQTSVNNVSSATTAINTMFTGLADSAKTAMSTVNTELSVDLKDEATTSFGGYTSTATDYLDKVPVAANNTATSASSALAKDTSAAGRYFVSGFLNTIGDVVYRNQAYQSAFDLSNSAVSGLMAGQDSHSPSRLAGKAGRFFIEGYANALRKGAEVAHDLGERVSRFAIDGLGTISDIIQNAMNVDESELTITPVLDLSMIQNGSDSIYDMLNSNPSVELGNVTAKSIRSKSEQLQMTLDDSVSTALKDFNKSREDMENPTYVLQVDNYLDARKVGQGTARYTKRELDDMNTRNNRFGGDK